MSFVGRGRQQGCERVGEREDSEEPREREVLLVC